MAKRTCSTAKCDADHYARGLCRIHYEREHHVQVSAPPETPPSRATERFWSKVDVGHPLGCWEWTGTTTRDDGHGMFHYGHHGLDVQMTAHRFAYIVLIGPIPDGKQLDHLCRNRVCVNPDHVEPVTHRENVLRGYGPTATNARKTHCKRGHEFTPDNTYEPSTRRERVCRKCLAERQAAYYQRKRAAASGKRSSP